MTQDSMIFAAAVFGTKAHKEGKMATPCLHGEFMKWLGTLGAVELLPLLKAWTAAWHDANLAA